MGGTGLCDSVDASAARRETWAAAPAWEWHLNSKFPFSVIVEPVGWGVTSLIYERLCFLWFSPGTPTALWSWCYDYPHCADKETGHSGGA